MISVLTIDGQEGGGGPLAAFLRVFVFCSFTSNRLVGDTYVALVWMGHGGGRRAQASMFAEEKYIEIYARSRIFHVSIARNVMRTYVRTSAKKIIYINNRKLCEENSCPTGCSICSSAPRVNQLQRR